MMRAALACLAALALVRCATVPPMPVVPATLPLDGPVTPLEGAVGAPRESWGPFRDLCTVTAIESEPPLVRVRTGSQTCIRIQATPAPDGATQITGYPADQTPQRLTISFRRERDGGVTGFGVSGSTVDRATPAQRRQIDAMVRDTAVEMARPELPPVLRQGAIWTEQRSIIGGGFEGAPLTTRCTVTGTGSIGGRPAVIATCDAAGSGRLFSVQRDTRFEGKITARTQQAIDVATRLHRATLIHMLFAGTFTRTQDGSSSSGPLHVRSLVRLE